VNATDPFASELASPIVLLRARELGHPERWLERGDIVRVARGIYAPAVAWRALAPWQRYLARIHATSLVHPDAIYCHESAAVLHGLPISGEPPEVHALLDGDGTSRVVGGVRWHTAVRQRMVEEVDGLLAVSRVDTVVDLARERHPASALLVADAALRGDARLTREMLAGVNESRPSSRGRRAARWVVDRASPVPESPLESLSRAVVEWLGFPAPELQKEFADGQERVDLWWPQSRVAGEADGDLKYDGRFGDPIAALRARRLRDARLRAHGVRAIAHWTWGDAVHAEPLRDVLRDAGLRPLAPPTPAPLHTLRRALAVGAPPPPSARLQ
jgi:hypothetical protein